MPDTIIYGQLPYGWVAEAEPVLIATLALLDRADAATTWADAVATASIHPAADAALTQVRITNGDKPGTVTEWRDALATQLPTPWERPGSADWASDDVRAAAGPERAAGVHVWDDHGWQHAQTALTRDGHPLHRDDDVMARINAFVTAALR